MSFFAAWIFYPLVLVAFCAGLGLLLDALLPRRIPGGLLVPIGVIPIAIVATIASFADGSEAFLVPALFVLAVAGAVFSLPWRRGQPAAEMIVVALSGFAVVAVPMIVAGEPNDSFEFGVAWAFPPSLALVAAMLTLCVLQLAEALTAHARAEALGALLLGAFAIAALVPGVLNFADGGFSSYDRLAELRQIGTGVEGQGPVLIVDEDLFGARHALDAGLEADSTGETDLDMAGIDLEQLFAYRTLVLSASPRGSRPPQPYRQIRTGDDYDVWQRPVAPKGPVLHHMALGDANGIVALPNCSEVAGLGLLALSNQLGLPAQSIAIIGASPDGRIVAAPPSDSRRLCGRRWDWIEAVGTEALGIG